MLARSLHSTRHMASWMLGRIKRETQAQQNAADAGRLEPLRTPGTHAGYTSYLVRVYGFEAPIEAAFGAVRDLALLLDLRRRSQLRLLKSDLAALGVIDTSTLPVNAVPPLLSIADALGWMYVVEQSAAAHGQLRDHLERSIPHELHTAGCYLLGSERAVGTRLEELGAAMDEHARQPEIATTVVEAARAGFRRQRVWFNYTPPSALIARHGR